MNISRLLCIHVPNLRLPNDICTFKVYLPSRTSTFVLSFHICCINLCHQSTNIYPFYMTKSSKYSFFYNSHYIIFHNSTIFYYTVQHSVFKVKSRSNLISTAITLLHTLSAQPDSHYRISMSGSERFNEQSNALFA